MSDFLIKRMVVISQRSRSAKAVDFHPQCTVITGENQTGKSSLIKSLVYAFGAQPRMTSAWKDEISKILVYFSIRGVDYKILRDGNTFAVFRDSVTPVHLSTSVTEGLGPFLANLFDFGIRLSSQSGEPIVPPPAFLLLPYYFDQDTSWTESWNGFQNLKQFKDWRRDLIEYHIGLKPNDYYTTKAQHIQMKLTIDQKQKALDVLKGVRDQVMDEYKEINFNIDLESFQKEITELLVHCGKIQKAADKIKEELVELHNKKIQIESQLAITESTLSEISDDYRFLEKQSDHLGCPICGAKYQSSFAEVFSLAKDRERCEHILSSLRIEQQEVVRAIDKSHQAHTVKSLEAERIRHLLEVKQQDVKLDDLIDSESKKKLKSVLAKKFEETNDSIFALLTEIKVLRTKLDSFNDKERKRYIQERFAELMRINLNALSVSGVPVSLRNDYTKKIQVQGSDQPRALLAYGFSILEMMRERTSAIYCPIIIDSPVQQEQDDKNHRLIVQFIKEHQPKDTQLIFGVVDRKSVDFSGSIIELRNKWKVLNPADFEHLYAEVEPFVMGSMQFYL